ncbi:MAG TPA: hypothetical protein VFQ13_15260, partial [Anaerolineales bacterium]|nr:hypothetical protein [Anaerolineales bacterium]
LARTSIIPKAGTNYTPQIGENMAIAKYNIKGNDKIRDYNSELEIDVDDKYEAYSKPIPEPTPYDNGFITWFNAFGVREKESRKDANVNYTVFLQAPPTRKTLFALYDGKPHEIKPEDADKGRVKFTLSVGDPPVGYFP